MSFKYIQLDKITENTGFIVFDRADLSSLEKKIIQYLQGIKEEDLLKPIDEKLQKLLQKYEERIFSCELAKKTFSCLGVDKVTTFMEAKNLIGLVKEFLLDNDLLGLLKKQINIRDLNNKFHLPFDLSIVVDYIASIEKEKSKDEIAKNLFKEVEMLKQEDKTALVVSVVKDFLSTKDVEKVEKILIDKKVKLLICSKSVDLLEECYNIGFTFVSPKTLKEVGKEVFYTEIVNQIENKGLKDVFVKMVENKVEKDKIAEILDVPWIKNKIKQKDLTKIVKLLKQ